MEVVRDHSATERVKPSILGGLQTAGRLAVLTLALSIGGDDHRPAKTAIQPDTVESECDGCDDPSNLESGTSLIGRRLLIKREGVRDLIVRIIRRDGAVEIDVDGKTYGIQKTLGVAVGKKITTIDIRGTNVGIVSEEYGEAIVSRAEIERVLATLTAAHSHEVTASVNARFTPQPNTILSTSISIKRAWNGWNGESEAFDVTFERTKAPTVLASSD